MIRGGSDGLFVRRVIVASLLVLTIAAGVMLLARYPAVPMLVFAGVLGAIVLDGVAWQLTRLRVPRQAGVAVAALGIVASLLVGALFGGPAILEQITTLLGRLPRHAGDLAQQLPAPLAGVLANSSGSGEPIAWSDLAPWVFGSLSGIFTTAFGAIAGIVGAFALAVFLALEPDRYLAGLLHLVPHERRARTADVLGSVAHALRWWLVGRCCAMAVVAALTFAGLLVLNVPQAFALGLIVGVLTFIPYVGPILAAIPATLIALSQSFETALWVVGLYTIVQGVENYLVTPIVQGRAVSLPPALLIAAGALLAVLFGVIGVLLSTPLIVCTVICIQAFYVQDVIGDDVRLLGEGSDGLGRGTHAPQREASNAGTTVATSAGHGT